MKLYTFRYFYFWIFLLTFYYQMSSNANCPFSWYYFKQDNNNNNKTHFNLLNRITLIMADCNFYHCKKNFFFFKSLTIGYASCLLGANLRSMALKDSFVLVEMSRLFRMFRVSESEQCVYIDLTAPCCHFICSCEKHQWTETRTLGTLVNVCQRKQVNMIEHIKTTARCSLMYGVQGRR